MLKFKSIILALFFVTPLYGEVYKCSTSGGIKYTQKPCNNGKKKVGGKWISIKEIRRSAILKKKKEVSNRLKLIEQKKEKEELQKKIAKIKKEEKEHQEEQEKNARLAEEQKKIEAKKKSRLRYSSIIRATANKVSHEKPKLVMAVKKSDSYIYYSEEFIVAANKLIEHDWCSFYDFEYMGGWVESSNYTGKYYLFCGGLGKVYLDIYNNTIRNKKKNYKIFLVDPE